MYIFVFCLQAAPVLESEPIQQVPQLQASVNQMQLKAAEVKQEADIVRLFLYWTTEFSLC